MRDLFNFLLNLIKKYFRDSFFITFPQVLGLLVGLITLPIILNNLPMKDYGLFQFVLALQVWLTVLTVGHMTIGAKRGIARNMEGTFLFIFFYRFRFLLILGLGCICASLFLYYRGFVTLSALLIILGLYFIFGYLPQISYPEFFIAKKQFKQFALWQIILVIVIQLSSTMAAFLSHDIIIFAVAQLGAITVISLAGFLYVVMKNNLIQSYRNKEIDTDCVSYGFKLIPVELTIGTSNQIANFLISSFSFLNLAVFSVASRLTSLFRNILSGSYNLLYSDFAIDKDKRLVNNFKSRLGQLMFLLWFIVIIFILLSFFYIHFFLPRSYQAAKFYLIIISLGLPAISCSAIMNTILSSDFCARELNIAEILPNVFKILLILFFGYSWRIIGVCVALAISDWVNFFFYYFLTFRNNLSQKYIHAGK